MKPIAVFIVIAALAVGTLAAGAKTVTSTQGNSNDATVAGVAGPAAAANASHKTPDKMMAPSAKKKAKTRTAQTQKPVPTTD
jgi:hypothetical protein